MYDPSQIKGIILDYGGTIDSHGDHWSEVICDQYKAAGVYPGPEAFADAYVYAERYLATHHVVKPDFDFLQLMRCKINVECSRLAELGHNIDPATADAIAQGCYDAARRAIDDVRPALEALAAALPMVVVSNFYGNIDSVLRDFDLRRLFKGIIESAMVGVRKPDSRIFRLGCTVLDLDPTNVLVVGDSIPKDIEPARHIGCHTAWIEGRQWKGDKEKSLAEKSTTLAEIAHTLLACVNK